jgi:hypothetical protein
MTVGDLIIEMTGIELDPLDHPTAGLNRQVKLEVVTEDDIEIRLDVEDVEYDGLHDCIVLKS